MSASCVPSVLTLCSAVCGGTDLAWWVGQWAGLGGPRHLPHVRECHGSRATQQPTHGRTGKLCLLGCGLEKTSISQSGLSPAVLTHPCASWWHAVSSEHRGVYGPCPSLWGRAGHLLAGQQGLHCAHARLEGRLLPGRNPVEHS